MNDNIKRIRNVRKCLQKTLWINTCLFTNTLFIENNAISKWAKNFRRHLTKKEDIPDHMSSGKSKLKQQDNPTHLLEWPQSGTLTAQNADDMWGTRNSHSLLVGCKNGAATFEDSLEVFYKTRHSLTYDLNN